MTKTEIVARLDKIVGRQEFVPAPHLWDLAREIESASLAEGDAIDDPDPWEASRLRGAEIDRLRAALAAVQADAGRADRRGPGERVELHERARRLEIAACDFRARFSHHNPGTPARD